MSEVDSFSMCVAELRALLPRMRRTMESSKERRLTSILFITMGLFFAADDKGLEVLNGLTSNLSIVILSEKRND
ncbi:MAG: hypothetical protein ACRCT2_01715 [Plesiomonas shigelloides]